MDMDPPRGGAQGRRAGSDIPHGAGAEPDAGRVLPPYSAVPCRLGAGRGAGTGRQTRDRRPVESARLDRGGRADLRYVVRCGEAAAGRDGTRRAAARLGGDLGLRDLPRPVTPRLADGHRIALIARSATRGRTCRILTLVPVGFTRLVSRMTHMSCDVYD